MLGDSSLAGRESGSGLLSHARPIHTGYPGSCPSLADVVQKIGTFLLRIQVFSWATPKAKNSSPTTHYVSFRRKLEFSNVANKIDSYGC